MSSINQRFPWNRIDYEDKDYLWRLQDGFIFLIIFYVGLGVDCGKDSLYIDNYWFLRHYYFLSTPTFGLLIEPITLLESPATHNHKDHSGDSKSVRFGWVQRCERENITSHKLLVS